MNGDASSFPSDSGLSCEWYQQRVHMGDGRKHLLFPPARREDEPDFRIRFHQYIIAFRRIIA